MVLYIYGMLLYNDHMTNTTTDQTQKQKLFLWGPETLEALAACRERGGHESDTAAVKAALRAYLRLLEITTDAKDPGKITA